MILAKLDLYHAKCCNQNYDLYQMREGSAGIIINEFNRFSGYKAQRLEMLQSGTVEYYIQKDKELAADPTIKEIARQIAAENSRIEKGVF